MTLTTYKWTIDRYHHAIRAGVFNDKPLELICGKLIVMPPEGETHAYYNSEVGDYLRSLLGNRAKIREAHPITLNNNSEPIPDLAIVKPLGRVYLEHHPYPRDIFWIIEFANTTLTQDLTTKKQIYAESGIPEYWVVNLQKNQLHVYTDLQKGIYATETILTTGTRSPIAFADVEIEVQRLIST